ncbi:b(0,+)-type amino acid transporter 1 [Patella vulgata]|uniref:b(0,+)-type amino acid transporter 1 n=1 Tax=Patella vulgata TaxID=6465 RepID=UPI0024A923A9|nr:b(0,+)-type amino acid transporter 1 [Patella vulgata]
MVFDLVEYGTETGSTEANEKAKVENGATVLAVPGWRTSESGSTSTISSAITETNEVALRKEVGLISGVALIVGTMIGSGIFVSPRGVLEGSGSVAMSLIVWAGCGFLAMMGALTYAELGTSIPLSGGEHAYLMHTFKPMNKCWGPVPAFLFDWLGIFVLRPAMFAIMSLSLGTYATQPFYGDCGAPLYLKKVVTVCAMLLILAINCYSVKLATIIQNWLTLVKLVAIAIITIGGFYKMATGSTTYISEGFEGTTQNPSVLALAFYNGLWAYDGWNNLNFVTEELKNPQRNLPLSIGLGIPLTTICYILVNIGYFSVISKEELLLSDAVAMTWSVKVIGILSWFMPIFVVLSCFGAANGSLFASGRLCLVAARDGHLPQVLSYIHINRRTPVPSLIFTTIVAILLILPSDLGMLIGFFGFTAWIFYGLTAASLLVLRYTSPDIKRPYKVPIIIPIFVVLASIYLVLAPIIMLPKLEYFYAILFILSGLLLYFPMVYNKCHPKWFVLEGLV